MSNTLFKTKLTYVAYPFFSFTRGSQEYKDFWLFLERYEAFNKKHSDNHLKGSNKGRIKLARRDPFILLA